MNIKVDYIPYKYTRSKHYELRTIHWYKERLLTIDEGHRYYRLWNLQRNILQYINDNWVSKLCVCLVLVFTNLITFWKPHNSRTLLRMEFSDSSFYQIPPCFCKYPSTMCRKSDCTTLWAINAFSLPSFVDLSNSNCLVTQCSLWNIFEDNIISFYI